MRCFGQKISAADELLVVSTKRCGMDLELVEYDMTNNNEGRTPMPKVFHEKTILSRIWQKNI